ncbi:MAG: AMP-binding protein [Deferribacteraceae bacterium]|jgi:long-chain acyl-CoA synthetase|nr:AMP-binding protein [Deferribacteraceae bacterium]
MQYKNLGQLISQNSQLFPNKTHIYHYDRTYTFAETDSIVNRTAAVLASFGVAKDSKVAILIGNSPEYMFAYFALMKLGAVAVPQNIFLKEKEISLNLNDCLADYIISSEAFAHVVSGVLELVPSIKNVFAFEPTSFKSVNIYKADDAPLPKLIECLLDDLAVLIYTSGTTGRAKGVMLTHGNLLANAKQYTTVVSMNADDKITAVLPIFHAYAFLVCVIIPLYVSGGVLLFDSVQDVGKEAYKKAVEAYKPTALIGVPQLFSVLARKRLTIKEQRALPFRFYMSGGAPLPLDTILKFRASYGKHIVEGYGLSEASPIVAMNQLNNTKPGTVGPLLPEMSCKIIGEDGQELGIDQEGELVVRGGNVMRGYWGLEAETAKVLSADGWLRTGDMAKIDEDGFITIVDRLKDLIIAKGMNIYPREIEECLYKHKSILHAAVLGVPEADGNEIVVAYVQLNAGETLSENDVKQYVKENFANYKVPKIVIFTDDIPVSPSGKVLKRELRERLLRENPR